MMPPPSNAAAALSSTEAPISTSLPAATTAPQAGTAGNGIPGKDSKTAAAMTASMPPHQEPLNVVIYLVNLEVALNAELIKRAQSRDSALPSKSHIFAVFNSYARLGALYRYQTILTEALPEKIIYCQKWLQMLYMQAVIVRSLPGRLEDLLLTLSNIKKMIDNGKHFLQNLLVQVKPSANLAVTTKSAAQAEMECALKRFEDGEIYPVPGHISQDYGPCNVMLDLYKQALDAEKLLASIIEKAPNVFNISDQNIRLWQLGTELMQLPITAVSHSVEERKLQLQKQAAERLQYLEFIIQQFNKEIETLQKLGEGNSDWHRDIVERRDTFLEYQKSLEYTFASADWMGKIVAVTEGATVKVVAPSQIAPHLVLFQAGKQLAATFVKDEHDLVSAAEATTSTSAQPPSESRGASITSGLG